MRKSTLLVIISIFLVANVFAQSSYTVHGFAISTDSTQTRTGSIVIENGTILLFGQQRAIKKLRISEKDYNDVTVNGVIEGGFTFDCGYEAPVTFVSGKMTKVGILAEINVPIPQYEKGLLFKDVTIKADGTISSTSYTKLSFEYNKFPVQINKSIFDGKTITLIDGTIKMPVRFRDGKVSIRQLYAEGLAFNGKGIVNDIPIENTNQINYTYKNWVLNFDSAKFEDAGLVGPVKIVGSSGAVRYEAVFSRFTVKGDGSIVSGTATVSNTATGAYPITLDDAQFIDTGNGFKLVCEKPCILINTNGAPSKLYLGKLVIDENGNATQESMPSQAVSFVSSNGCDVKATSVVMQGDSIYLAGDIKLSTWSNPITFDKPVIKLDPTFAVCVDVPDMKTVYTAGGSTINGKGFYINSDGVEIKENAISFSGVNIDLGSLKFDKKGNILTTVNKDVNQKIAFFNDSTVLKSVNFSEKNGLSLVVQVKVPGVFSEVPFVFENVKILSDSQFEVSKPIEKLTTVVGTTKYTLENVSLEKQNLRIGDVIVDLPGLGTNGATTVNCETILVSPNGDVKRESSAAISVTRLWGLPLFIEDCSFTKEAFKFSGKVRLPEGMPGVLNNLTIPINYFELAHSGEYFKADIRQEVSTNTEIPFVGNFKTQFSAVNVKYKNGRPVIELENAYLIFPDGYPVSPVAVKDYAFDIEGKSCIYSDVKPANPFSFTIGGKQFDISDFSILSDQTVVLLGGTNSETQFTSEPTDVKFFVYPGSETAKVQYFEKE